jgi:hypothetical protein
MSPTIDLVLPVNPTLRNDDRRMRICLSSLDRYLEPASVGQLLIVVPDGVAKDSVQAVTWGGHPVQFATKVVHDRELLGLNPWRSRVGSWHTQQFVKLGAADHLTSDFYITLDSDVILTQPTCFADLIVAGRAITAHCERAVHASWWKASAELLETDPMLSTPGMEVTPAILSVQVTRALMRYLEAKGQGPWYRGVVEFIDDQKARGLYQPQLSSPMPTEYTLYYLFAQKQGWAAKYHVESTSLWCRQQLFRPEDLADCTARVKAAAAGTGRFFVLQSVLGVSPEWVWERVSREFALA